MADKKVMYAVVVIVVVAVVAVAAFFVLNNGNNSEGDDYYFYINFGDNDVRTDWYSAKANTADDALAKAVKGTEVTLNYSNGYPVFSSGYWAIYEYVYSDCSKVAADNSILYPYTLYGAVQYSNGWNQFAGYGDGTNKISQGISNIYYFAEYAADYSVADPTADKLWMTADGPNPFNKGVKYYGDNTKYYFYVNLGDDNIDTKWYSATAKNADEALEAALKGTGIALTYGESGYPYINGNAGSVFAYRYVGTGSDAANASVNGAIYTYGSYFNKSNGWMAFNGYDSLGVNKKVFESGSVIFMLSPYASDWSVTDPTESLLWMTNGGDNPFKA